MLDFDPFPSQPDRCDDDARLLYVPFMPGATILRDCLSSATAEERQLALDELAGIGQVLHELVDLEETSVRSFQGLVHLILLLIDGTKV